MIPYLARLLDIKINNSTIQSDWEKATGVSYLQSARSRAGIKSQTRQSNLSGQQVNGTRYGIYPRKIWDKSD
jgi:hypothetical protein